MNTTASDTQPEEKPGKLVKRLAPKEIFGDEFPKKLIRLDLPDSPKGPIVLYDMFLIIRGVRFGSGQNGSWVQFIGDMEAVRIDTGENIVSNRAHVPQPMEDMLYGAVMEAASKEANKPVAELQKEGVRVLKLTDQSVQTAVRVSIKAPNPNKPSATGYEFVVEPLIAQERVSPLQALRLRAQPAIARLSAPKSETTGSNVPSLGSSGSVGTTNAETGSSKLQVPGKR